jgi:hypothetical protein
MPIQNAAHWLVGNLCDDRADLSLGAHDLALVAEMVDDVAPDWSVEMAGDCAADSSVVVMPPGADDRLGPTFIVRHVGSSVHIDALQWDECHHIATVPTVRYAVDSLKPRLAALVASVAATEH